MNAHSSVYSRRRAVLNRAHSGYLTMSIQNSRESMEKEEDSDAESVKSISSTLSYKTWKKMQKKKQKARLERAQSLVGYSDCAPASTTRLNPLSFASYSGNTLQSVSKGAHHHARKGSSSLLYETESIEEEHGAPGDRNETSTTLQSSLDPYYSSSDVEGATTDEDDDAKLSNGLIHLKSLPTSDEQTNTRDWLISETFEPDEHKNTRKRVDSLQHHIVLAKPVAREQINRVDISNLQSSRPVVEGGLNDLATFVTVPQGFESLSVSEESKNKEDNVKPCSFGKDKNALSSFQKDPVDLPNRQPKISDTSTNFELINFGSHLPACSSAAEVSSRLNYVKPSEIRKADHSGAGEKDNYVLKDLHLFNVTATQAENLNESKEGDAITYEKNNIELESADLPTEVSKLTKDLVFNSTLPEEKEDRTKNEELKQFNDSDQENSLIREGIDSSLEDVKDENNTSSEKCLTANLHVDAENINPKSFEESHVEDLLVDRATTTSVPETISSQRCNEDKEELTNNVQSAVTERNRAITEHNAGRPQTTVEKKQPLSHNSRRTTSAAVSTEYFRLCCCNIL